MEYTSVLAGRRWSDHPRCTDPAVGERPAADVVVLAVARAGLSLRPDDRMLRRAERLARDRLARGAEGPAARRWWRRAGWWVVGPPLHRALADLDRVLVGRTRAERDGLRVALLRTAAEDVRRHVGADEPATCARPGTELTGTT